MQAYKVDMQVSILNIFENRALSSSCREKKYCDGEIWTSDSVLENIRISFSINQKFFVCCVINKFFDLIEELLFHYNNFNPFNFIFLFGIKGCIPLFICEY